MQSLIHQPGFEGVRGIVLGRFQRASNMDRETLVETIRNEPELGRVPIVANASFGHTTPAFTMGRTGSLRAHEGHAQIRIQTH